MTMKKFLAAFLSAAMAVTSAAIPVFADESAPVEAADDGIELMATTPQEWTSDGGNGTSSESPYTIKTAAGLKALATAVNGGTTYENTYFKLMTDINLGCDESNLWTSIGKSFKYFKGILTATIKQ